MSGIKRFRERGGLVQSSAVVGQSKQTSTYGPDLGEVTLFAVKTTPDFLEIERTWDELHVRRPKRPKRQKRKKTKKPRPEPKNWILEGLDQWLNGVPGAPDPLTGRRKAKGTSRRQRMKAWLKRHRSQKDTEEYKRVLAMSKMKELPPLPRKPEKKIRLPRRIRVNRKPGARIGVLEWRHPKVGGDQGGLFSKYKHEFPYALVQAVDKYKLSFPTYDLEYNGGFAVTSFGSSSINASDIVQMGIGGAYGPNYMDPSPYGAAAYAKFAPKQEVVNMGQFLYELRDLPGQLKTSLGGIRGIYKQLLRKQRESDLSDWRSPAGHFLNHVFGWEPFVKDLKTIVDTYDLFAFKLHEARMNNGKWIKREGTFSKSDQITNQVTSIHSGTTVTSGAHPSFWSNSLQKYRTTTYQRLQTKVWFSGSFRFWIPDLGAPDDGINHLRNLLRVYGARITPHLVWKITPWSWLSDWFSNTGALFKNLADIQFDNLAHRYAYIMMRSQLQAVNDTKVLLRPPLKQPNCFWAQNLETKKRRHAYKFNFATSSSELSARQSAILVALGITRMPRSI